MTSVNKRARNLKFYTERGFLPVYLNIEHQSFEEQLRYILDIRSQREQKTIGWEVIEHMAKNQEFVDESEAGLSPLMTISPVWAEIGSRSMHATF